MLHLQWHVYSAHAIEELSFVCLGTAGSVAPQMGDKNYHGSQPTQERSLMCSSGHQASCLLLKTSLLNYFLGTYQAFNRELVGENLLCSASELICEGHFCALVHTFPKRVSQESASTVLDGLPAIKRRLVGKVKVDRFLRSKFLMLNFKSILVEVKIILP